jgi:hypothetical protein
LFVIPSWQNEGSSLAGLTGVRDAIAVLKARDLLAPSLQLRIP